ncbi:unnamed protein product [Acanthosepion pharaonis]|uniref:Uncharacterized protein n=1 Tax=Acanthosepion pharaonis TaxID=158019 RepID=A0A812BM14_ACAPH|nr:unnamed protein product [Sepia pharaonis]
MSLHHTSSPRSKWGESQYILCYLHLLCRMSLTPYIITIIVLNDLSIYHGPLTLSVLVCSHSLLSTYLTPGLISRKKKQINQSINTLSLSLSLSSSIFLYYLSSFLSLTFCLSPNCLSLHRYLSSSSSLSPYLSLFSPSLSRYLYLSSSLFISHLYPATHKVSFTFSLSHSLYSRSLILSTLPLELTLSRSLNYSLSLSLSLSHFLTLSHSFPLY